MLTQQIINGLTLGSLYALLAVGFSLICGILNMITFSHGEIFMIGAFSGLYTIIALGGNLPLGLAAAVVVSAAAGILTERIAFRPFRNESPLSPALITIGLSISLQAGILLLFGADTKPFPYNVSAHKFILGNTVISGIEVFVIGISILLMIMLHLFIHYTRWGLALRATSQRIEAADIMGISTNRIIAIAFCTASLLAGIDGLLAGAYYSAFYPRMGVAISLKALAGATFGGIGSIQGAMAGALSLGVIESLAAGYISASYRDVIAFTILIFVLLIKPSGLLGQMREEKV